ncbi:hypothetical protein KM043_003503 [Ampulex compressa]|nr:hypothetical protein KM043_003503 [Ampulex compressa]
MRRREERGTRGATRAFLDITNPPRAWWSGARAKTPIFIPPGDKQNRVSSPPSALQARVLRPGTAFRPEADLLEAADPVETPADDRCQVPLSSSSRTSSSLGLKDASLLLQTTAPGEYIPFERTPLRTYISRAVPLALPGKPLLDARLIYPRISAATRLVILELCAWLGVCGWD